MKVKIVFISFGMWTSIMGHLKKKKSTNKLGWSILLSPISETTPILFKYFAQHPIRSYKQMLYLKEFDKTQSLPQSSLATHFHYYKLELDNQNQNYDDSLFNMGIRPIHLVNNLATQD
jgi:hypothetical protein